MPAGRHFAQARMAVQTAEPGLSPTSRAVETVGGTQGLDDVDSALFEIAKLRGTEGWSLLRRMQRCGPSRQPTPAELE